MESIKGTDIKVLWENLGLKFRLNLEFYLAKNPFRDFAKF